MYRPRHAHDDLFTHNLDRTREVHLPLRELRFRYPGWSGQQLVERPVGHREAGEIVEVLLVERERAILSQVDKLAVDRLDVLGLTVRRWGLGAVPEGWVTIGWSCEGDLRE